MSTPKKLNQRLEEQLQNIADTDQALLLSFIAPDSIVRKSPASFDYASIKVRDFYQIESIIEGLKEENKLPEKLHLIIQTPGGDLATSTKIAKYLQHEFDDRIEAYVPYEAASGGTIICLAAKCIVMGTTSNISPIDPQIPYRYGRIAATTYQHALNDFEKKYGNMRPEEIPSPYQQMANQFDPVTAKEMSKIAWDTLDVAYKLLLNSQKPDPKKPDEQLRISNSVFSLGSSDSPHSHIITADEAKKIGLNIDDSNENLTRLKLYKQWVTARLNEEQEYHIIETFIPKNGKKQTAEKKEDGVKERNK